MTVLMAEMRTLKEGLRINGLETIIRVRRYPTAMTSLAITKLAMEKSSAR